MIGQGPNISWKWSTIIIVGVLVFFVPALFASGSACEYVSQKWPAVYNILSVRIYFHDSSAAYGWINCIGRFAKLLVFVVAVMLLIAAAICVKFKWLKNSKSARQDRRRGAK